MKLRTKLLSTSVALVAFASTGLASASSHREAPSISNDAAADNTDTYAWRCNEKGVPSLCITANYDGLQLPEGGPNYYPFSTSALYSLHITHNDANGVPNLADYITIDVDFKAGPKNLKNANFKRVEVDDKAAGPGGGKEFFAQIAGYFDITANVAMTKRLPNGTITRKTLFTGAAVPPPNIGTRTTNFAYGAPGKSYEDFSKTFIKSANGYQFFAGQRRDAFYVNLAQVFDLGAFVGLNTLGGAPFRSKIYDVDPSQTGQFANTDPKKAPDGVAGLNTNTIAISIPLTELMPDGKAPAPDAAPSNNTLFGVWASASRPGVLTFSTRTGLSVVPLGDDGREYTGAYVQVSRLGLPLINEVVIGLEDKDLYNRTTPSNDVNNFGKYFLNPIIVRDIEAVGGYAQLGIANVPDDFKYGRADILGTISLTDIPTKGAHPIPIENGRIGDVLRVDVAVPSGFPNGRSLSGDAVKAGKEEDVTDVLLSVLLSKGTVPIPDGVGGPGDGKKLLTYFPYLASPSAGDTEGRGSPAKL